MTREKVQQYVRDNYDYDGADDPLDIANISEFDNLAISLMDGREGFFDVVKVGDWFIEDGVSGEVVRIVNGEVTQIWINM